MPLERWALIYAEAARELGIWVHSHRSVARRLFEWDDKIPEESRELVIWLVANPKSELAMFTSHHQDWRLLIVSGDT